MRSGDARCGSRDTARLTGCPDRNTRISDCAQYILYWAPATCLCVLFNSLLSTVQSSDVFILVTLWVNNLQAFLPSSFFFLLLLFFFLLLLSSSFFFLLLLSSSFFFFFLLPSSTLLLSSSFFYSSSFFFFLLLSSSFFYSSSFFFFLLPSSTLLLSSSFFLLPLLLLLFLLFLPTSLSSSFFLLLLFLPPFFSSFSFLFFLPSSSPSSPPPPATTTPRGFCSFAPNHSRLFYLRRVGPSSSVLPSLTHLLLHLSIYSVVVLWFLLLQSIIFLTSLISSILSKCPHHFIHSAFNPLLLSTSADSFYFLFSILPYTELLQISSCFTGFELCIVIYTIYVIRTKNAHFLHKCFDLITVSSTCFEHPSVRTKEDLYMQFYGIFFLASI